MIRQRYLLVLLCFLSGYQFAVADGVLEINQTCALNGGCFPGDSAGFPVTIDGSAGVSYRLTGSLDLSSVPDAIAIQIDASNVTLDLNGFEIRGPVICSGSGPTLDCGPQGSATGIRLNAGAEGGLIRNGTIRNMDGSGVASAASGHITLHQLRAINNTRDGFRGGNSSVVTESIALRNGDDGFQFSIGSVIERSTAEGNGNNGIEIDAQRGVVRSSTTRRNGGRGFELGHSSKYRDNTSDFNSEPDRCGGGICTEQRRFYLTQSEYDGNEVLNACADGFHMASITEIHDLGALEYDNIRGRVGEDGNGVPVGIGLGTGWIRTGLESSSDGNCNLWTSDKAGIGGALISWPSDGGSFDLSDPAIAISPWKKTSGSCGDTWPVYCIED